MIIKPFVAAVALLMAAFAPVRAASPTSVLLRRDGANWVLTAKGKRLTLPIKRPAYNPLPASIYRTADGTTITILPDKALVQIRSKSGQKGEISLSETLKKWLLDDDKWGGHPAANVLRGIANHGGLQPVLSKPVLSGDALLAIFSTYPPRGSGEPIVSQQLVRIETDPKPGLRMLRCLAIENSPIWLMAPRLYNWHGKTVLLARANDSRTDWSIEAINSQGETQHKIGAFPITLTPKAIIGGRWLALAANKKQSQPIWTVDLTTGKSAPLPGNWNGYTAPYSLFMPTGTETIPYLLWIPGEEKEGGPSRSFAVHLPDGKRTRSLPAPVAESDVAFWNGFVVLQEGRDRRPAVYDARTGKHLTLTSPNSAER